ncbi:ABC transporter substrate-binding protein [Marivibrio halodurans]|uniref:ABC transporter substrate-binding protein n=1 Tax=Marivibrio halodurans TaxID=2039722 RepID=A0A8J7V2C8_9PROT|nr:ABC transporter substrate-binding protein [Marivibrio halodurans]MBP5857036.1 ABC transporter substrate-binding protein [Marivibrio halodurans]
MSNRPSFLLAAAAAVLALITVNATMLPARAAADGGAGDFIVNLGERAVGALTDKSIDQGLRQERFRDLLKEGLDLRHIAEFVLGSYRRRASDQQMQDFLSLLEDNIVQNYARRFRNYSGEELKLLNVRDGGRDSSIVSTELSQTGGAPPIQVDWRVHEVDGQFKVIDIVVEGISMMVTQRDEYVGYMRSNGGIDALMDALRKQNQALEKRQEG